MRIKKNAHWKLWKLSKKTGVKAVDNNVSNKVSKVGILTEIKALLLFGREKGEDNLIDRFLFKKIKKEHMGFSWNIRKVWRITNRH